jgi:hypothetical protein
VQTADFDHESFESRAQAEEDKKLLVKFFVKPRPDSAETVKQGRPIFKDVEYIDIRIPGDRTGGVSRPASHNDKQRFAPHYAAFKQRTEVPLEGTPLIEWPLITRSLAEELAFHNVKTVEHLSTMSDTHSGKFMGLNALKAKALKWLEQAGEEAKVHELQQELLERDERIATQGQQIELLQKQMLEMMGNKPAPAEVLSAPSLNSELDDVVTPEPEPTVAAAPATKQRRRRKAAPDGKIQNDQ